MIITMPHVSKRKLDTQTHREVSRMLQLILGKLNHQEVDLFLSSLLSETERTMIAKRLAVAVLLSYGIKSNVIAEKLHVTFETVNRIKSSTLLKPKGYKLAYGIIAKDQMLTEIKKGLLRLVGYVARAAGGRVTPDIF